MEFERLDVEYNKLKKDITPQTTSKGINDTNFSNPISMPKILPLTTRSSANKLYGGYTSKTAKNDIDYAEIIASLNLILPEQSDSLHLFCDFHVHARQKLNLNYSALGLYNTSSNYINLKLIDKMNVSYNSKILLNDTQNPIVEAYKTKKTVITDNNDYLKLNYLPKSPTVIVPLCAFSECMGVAIFASDNYAQHVELYKLISNYYAVFYKNKQLLDLVDTNTDIDSLTALPNYKRLQETLTQEVNRHQEGDKPFAFCIIDIANISEINSELGHAKGDAIIKEVAKKIKLNIKSTHFAGRYGGDKIGIIMQETTQEEAKYMCEFLLYSLSCTMFDDLGQLKFSCGISMFPSSSNKQEQLVTLAEQALYMAKSKRSQSGQSEIVTTDDYNFWDNDALKCFAEVLTKKHANVGLNIEEELIKQFHSEEIVSNEHMLDVVLSLANTIDAKDTYTKGHSASVSRYSEALARAINLPANEVERIKLGALLHDIGKIGIPEHVLRKPTMLSDEEWQIMKQHPTIGSDKVLKPNKSLHDLIPMVKYHHEHIDGTGYPYGLKGDEIPLSARIVAIADAYHALISDRPYRKGLSVKKACEILKMGAGAQWDKELVRQFIIIAPSLATNI